ncbi:MAG TPA: hypothetical protein VHE83_09145 [Mycobacteriales bacterium]|nr:hypothetical protein [Mycobacteriales bacterium]
MSNPRPRSSLALRSTEPGPHLGAATTALVDGRLSGWARDRALGHVSVCPSCRAEVEEQRRLKAHLAELSTPSTPADLMSRLLEMRPAVTVTPPPVSTAPTFGGLFPAHSFVGASAHAAPARSVKRPLVAGIAGVGLLAGGLAIGMALRGAGPVGGGGGRVVDPMLTSYSAPPTAAPLPRTRASLPATDPSPFAR